MPFDCEPKAIGTAPNRQAIGNSTARITHEGSRVSLAKKTGFGYTRRSKVGEGAFTIGVRGRPCASRRHSVSSSEFASSA